MGDTSASAITQPCCQAKGEMAISPGLREALVSTKPVRGLTHNFYRYPARFSPEFARQVILAFTKPSDCVLDPFVGGGTTVIESLAAGRQAVGIDINSLAYFTSLVKTTPLSANDIESILLWSERVLALDPPAAMNEDSQSLYIDIPPEAGSFLASAAHLAAELRFPRQQRFARCSILRTGQLSLDCRSSIPDLAAIRNTFKRSILDMITTLDRFVAEVQSNGIPRHKITSMRRLFLGSTGGSIVNKVQSSLSVRPTLVLTSPPYPLIHVLYNKWQVLGRRETTVPYRLAALNDGQAPSFYTMGTRSLKGLDTYFRDLLNAFVNIRNLVAPGAIIVQLVAFPDEESVRTRYLATLEQARFKSLELTDENGSPQVIRVVPNRRWYTGRHEKQLSSREMLMIHQAS